MGNLYRVLKGKVEGSPVQGKSSNGKKSGVGSSATGKQGMADALAEMTKRYVSHSTLISNRHLNLILVIFFFKNERNFGN